MRCCVPFCKNTSTNVSTSETKGISFHALPSDVHLRAAWLRALSVQDSHLLDSAMVCSQHFLDDDIYETKRGLRQIGPGAIPSLLQVCMICLDTDSKMFLMSEHKLEEAYERLTEYPLYDLRTIKQTVCVQCAQRLINFSRFRDKSLRARALMMDLVEKHELITRQHIKKINRTKHQLNTDLVVTTLGPDHCDLYILDSSEDKQTESQPIGDRSTVVKNEESYDSSDGEEMEEAKEDDNTANNHSEKVACIADILPESEIILETKQVAEIPDPLKSESAPVQCTLCSEEFGSEHAYMQHMRMHDLNGDGDAVCGTSQVCKPPAASSQSSHLTENDQDMQLEQASTSSSDSSQAADVRVSRRNASSSLSLEDRKTIVRLHDNGLNISQISREMGLSRNTVSRWVRRFNAEGTVKDRERSGRPPIITKTQRDFMVHEYQTNGFIRTERFANEFDISVQTVRRALHSEGLRLKRRPRKPRQRRKAK